MYVNRILEYRLPDGGWSLNTAAETCDPEITGMALQALAKYRGRSDVLQAVNEALERISFLQNENGGFSSWDTENSESCAQMLIALCTPGIEYNDPRFTKNGRTMLDNLMTFYNEDNGTFRHTSNDTVSDQMATEQGFCALVAVSRLKNQSSGLYDMSSTAALSVADNLPTANGLPGKHSDINVPAVTLPEKTFNDILSAECRVAVEALASRGIINGMPNGSFAPDSNITRAEFAAIIVRSLGLLPKECSRF